MKGWFAVLAIVVGAPMTLQAAEATVVVLHQDSLVKDEQRLIEALRIYTRDVYSRVITRGTAPGTVDGDALELIAARGRAEAADVVLWAQRRDDNVAVFYLFNVATGVVRETEIGANAGEPAAVEVALKVRAILANRRRITSAAALAVHAQTPSEPDSAPAVAPSAPPPLVAPRFALGAGFHILSPLDTTWARLGVLVDAAVRLGGATSRYWLYLDGAFNSRPRARTAAFDVTMRDLPFGAGVQKVWSPGRFALALGTRTSLHVFDVEATAADGKFGAARRYAAGLGVLGRAAIGLGPHAKMAAAFFAEGLIPTQEFTVAGQRALATGSLLMGATAGLVIDLP